VTAEQRERWETETGGPAERGGREGKEREREEVGRGGRGRRGRCSDREWCRTITPLEVRSNRALTVCNSVSLNHGSCLDVAHRSEYRTTEVGSAFVFLGSVVGTTNTFARPVSSLPATPMSSAHTTAISRVRCCHVGQLVTYIVSVSL
jgi:hypothetical protein